MSRADFTKGVIGREGQLAAVGAASKLRKWLLGGISGKTIVFSGDSTTLNATTLFSEFSGLYQKPGERLEGTTIVNRGSTGASLASFLSDGITFGITDLKAQTAHLIVFCWGINDVRVGATKGAAIRANLISAVNQLRTAKPGVPIILWTPNSFTTDDVGAAGLVTATGDFAAKTVAQAAQACTDILWGVYNSLRESWPDVLLLDKQEISGRVCVASTAQANMTDQIHPNATYQKLIAEQFVDVAGYRAGFDASASAAAWAASPTTPWTVYARAIEDPAHTTLRASGVYSAGTLGGGFFDFAWPVAPDIAIGDYVQMGTGGSVFKIPVGSTITQQTQSVTRILGMGGSYPPATMTGGIVNVWR